MAPKEELIKIGYAVPPIAASLHERFIKAYGIKAQSKAYTAALMVWAGLPQDVRDEYVSNVNAAMSIPGRLEALIKRAESGELAKDVEGAPPMKMPAPPQPHSKAAAKSIPSSPGKKLSGK